MKAMNDIEHNTAILVGISSCVLGQEVRYNGGHKRHTFCADILGGYVNFVPICPEMGIGLGTPRPSIRLLGKKDATKEDAIIARSEIGVEVTVKLRAYARDQGKQLNQLSGYIFCANSPSCGMDRVRVYGNDEKSYVKNGVGIYAAEVMRMCPLLPTEEDGRLNDPRLRENFITRVYAYHDWLTNVAVSLTAAHLIAFHTRYKYLLLAHQPAVYDSLGSFLADLSGKIESKAAHYIEQFMQALQWPATRGNHSNVLRHIQGHFKRHLTSAERQELAGVIDDYQQSVVPLLAPLTLIRHYLAKYPEDYIAQQRYLQPYPDALALRYSL